MTTLEDDVRDALRRRAEAHEVVVPDLDELVREPYAAGGPAAPRRRVLAGTIAALLVVVLGIAALALTDDDRDDPHPPATTVSEPTAGTHGAVLVGFGPPVDGDELLFRPPPGQTTVPWTDAGPLVVLDERDGDGTAVVAFAPEAAHSSFDAFLTGRGTPTEVGGRPATSHPEAPATGTPLAVLEVDRGGGERLFVGTTGIDAAEARALAEAALAATDPLRGWWSAERWAAKLAGPDRNPFAGGGDGERRLVYERDGASVGVVFTLGVADPADYAWSVGGTVTEVAGRRIVRTPGRRGAESTAVWAEGGGMVAVHAPASRDLDALIAAVRLVDEATWEAERAAATDPGSHFVHVGTTMPSSSTTTG